MLKKCFVTANKEMDTIHFPCPLLANAGISFCTHLCCTACCEQNEQSLSPWSCCSGWYQKPLSLLIWMFANGNWLKPSNLLYITIEYLCQLQDLDISLGIKRSIVHANLLVKNYFLMIKYLAIPLANYTRCICLLLFKKRVLQAASLLL